MCYRQGVRVCVDATGWVRDHGVAGDRAAAVTAWRGKGDNDLTVACSRCDAGRCGRRGERDRRWCHAVRRRRWGTVTYGVRRRDRKSVTVAIGQSDDEMSG